MKRHLWGLALAGVLIGFAGCATDPTDSISGTPARIVPTYSKIFMFPGDSLVVTAQVRDEQGTALAVPVTVASSDAGIAAVGDDPLQPYTDTRFYVRADGVGGATLTLTAEGLTTDIVVSVFPAVFEGDVTVVSSAILDTVVIDVGTSGLLFVPGETAVTIDGTPARIVAESAEQLKVIPRTVGALTDVTLNISTLIFLEGTEYEAAIAALDAANPLSVSGEDNEPGNDDPATATPITVGGASLEGLISDTDVDDFFVFTLAAATEITIEVAFDGGGGDPDLDVFLLNAAGGGFCVLDGCGMATGAQPEDFTGTLAAGTYTVLVELYDSGADAPPHWYRIRIN